MWRRCAVACRRQVAPDVLDLMRQAEVAMQAVVAAKLQLFGSVGKV